jgi:hypothetical protein
MHHKSGGLNILKKDPKENRQVSHKKDFKKGVDKTPGSSTTMHG